MSVLYVLHLLAEARDVASMGEALLRELLSPLLWIALVILALAVTAHFDTIRPFVDLWFEKTRKRTLLKRLETLLATCDELALKPVGDDYLAFAAYGQESDNWHTQVRAILKDECLSGSLAIFEAIEEPEWLALTREYDSQHPHEGLTNRTRALLELRKRSLRRVVLDHYV